MKFPVKFHLSINDIDINFERNIVYKFNDSVDTPVLTGAVWNSVNTDSAIEYDTASTAISLTNGTLLESYHVSADNDF